MTALWERPLRAVTVRGEDEVLVCGVLTDTYGQDGVAGSDHSLLVIRADGSLEKMRLSDVVVRTVYGQAPWGLGWYHSAPDGEDPTPLEEFPADDRLDEDDDDS